MIRQILPYILVLLPLSSTLAYVAIPANNPTIVCSCVCLQVCCTATEITALSCPSTEQAQFQTQTTLIQMQQAKNKQIADQQAANQQLAQQLANHQLAQQQLTQQQKLAQQQLGQQHFVQTILPIQPLQPPLVLPGAGFSWTNHWNGIHQTEIQNQHLLPSLGWSVDVSRKYLLALILSICEDQIGPNDVTTSSPPQPSDPPVDDGVQAQRSAQDCESKSAPNDGLKRPLKICKMLKQQLQDFIIATLDTKPGSGIYANQLISRSKFIQSLMPW